MKRWMIVLTVKISSQMTNTKAKNSFLNGFKSALNELGAQGILGELKLVDCYSSNDYPFIEREIKTITVSLEDRTKSIFEIIDKLRKAIIDRIISIEITEI